MLSLITKMIVVVTIVVYISNYINIIIAVAN